MPHDDLTLSDLLSVYRVADDDADHTIARQLADDAEIVARWLADETRASKADLTDSTVFVASEPVEDRAGDVVASSWVLQHYRRNPVILGDHNRTMVVGRAVEVHTPAAGDDAGKLLIAVRFDMSSPDPAIAVYGHQHREGFRSAVSVGFAPGKRTKRSELAEDHTYYAKPKKVQTAWGEYEITGSLYERNELLEVSSVSIPMLRSALQRHYLDRLAEHDSEDVAARAAVVAETVPRAVGASLIEAIQADPTIARQLVDVLWADVLAAARRDPAAYTAIMAGHEGRARPITGALRALATLESK